MPNISKLNINDVSYDIKDSTARTHIANDNIHVTADEKTAYNDIVTNGSKTKNSLTIGSYVFDGTSAITIPTYNGETS